MLLKYCYATICLGIIVLNDNIRNGADSKMIRDLRLDEEIFKKMIGKQFNKHKCDPFVFTNTVTGIVGLYIGKKVFELKNEQTAFQYFDSMDDVALWNIKEVNDSEIHSVFENTEQIDTSINQNIKSITLVNEHQMVNINDQEYDLRNHCSKSMWKSKSYSWNPECRRCTPDRKSIKRIKRKRI